MFPFNVSNFYCEFQDPGGSKISIQTTLRLPKVLSLSWQSYCQCQLMAHREIWLKLKRLKGKTSSFRFISFHFPELWMVEGQTRLRDLNGPLQKSLHGFSALKLCERRSCQSWDICKTRGKILAVRTIFYDISRNLLHYILCYVLRYCGIYSGLQKSKPDNFGLNSLNILDARLRKPQIF